MSNIDKALIDFVGEEEKSFEEKVIEQKKELLNTKTGLIERVDKIFVTNDGRQLLREQY